MTIKINLRRSAGMAALASLTMAITGVAAMAQTVTAVPSVDLNRFEGSWYEIARLPSKREKACIADVVDLVASGDRKNDLQLVSSCKSKDAYEDVRSADIKAEKNSGGGKLKVTYIWPFSEKEWVLALDGDYQWALIGSPNRKTMRVLSRTRELSPDVLAAIKQKAVAEGFAADKLKMTLQTGR